MNNITYFYSLCLSDTNRKRTAVELTPASSSATAPTLLASSTALTGCFLRFSTWKICSSSGSATDLHPGPPPWRENAERN